LLHLRLLKFLVYNVSLLKLFVTHSYGKIIFPFCIISDLQRPGDFPWSMKYTQEWQMPLSTKKYCVSQTFCHCDKMPHRNNFKGGSVCFTQFLRVQFMTACLYYFEPEARVIILECTGGGWSCGKQEAESKEGTRVQVTLENHVPSKLLPPSRPSFLEFLLLSKIAPPDEEQAFNTKALGDISYWYNKK
jgi:hypothetical protein